MAGDQLQAGVIVLAGHIEADAALAKAEADLLQAEMGLPMARAELDRVIGRQGP